MGACVCFGKNGDDFTAQGTDFTKQRVGGLGKVEIGGFGVHGTSFAEKGIDFAKLGMGVDFAMNCDCGLDK